MIDKTYQNELHLVTADTENPFIDLNSSISYDIILPKLMTNEIALSLTLQIFRFMLARFIMLNSLVYTFLKEFVLLEHLVMSVTLII